MSRSRLHIDGIVFSLQRHGGISVYFRELIPRLAAAGVEGTLTLETPVAQALDEASVTGFGLAQRRARPGERYRDCRPLNSARRDTLFHSTYYRRPADKRTPSVVTVYDFIYERRVGGLKTWVHRTQKNAALARADAILCLSEATRDDLLELAPPKAWQSVHVVHLSGGETFRPLTSSETSAGPSAKPFMLFVGQRGGYKNFGLALQAMRALPELELQCVGGGPLAENELSSAPEDVRARVRHLGYVDDDRLNELYNRSECLLYPSAYEGFGIPVLEAMRAGCPVVTIDCKAVLEVGGSALSVAEEPTGEALAAAVRRVLEPELRQEMRVAALERSRQFSWDRTAEETLSVYRSLGLS